MKTIGKRGLAKTGILIIAIGFIISLYVGIRMIPVIEQAFPQAQPASRFYYYNSNYWLDEKNGTQMLLHPAVACPKNNSTNCTFNTTGWYPEWAGIYWVDYANQTKVGFGYWAKYSCTNANMTVCQIVNPPANPIKNITSVVNYNNGTVGILAGTSTTVVTTTVFYNNFALWYVWYFIWFSNFNTIGYGNTYNYYASDSAYAPTSTIDNSVPNIQDENAIPTNTDGNPDDSDITSQGDNQDDVPQGDDNGNGDVNDNNNDDGSNDDNGGSDDNNGGDDGGDGGDDGGFGGGDDG